MTPRVSKNILPSYYTSAVCVPPGPCEIFRHLRLVMPHADVCSHLHAKSYEQQSKQTECYALLLCINEMYVEI
jgi:hypothetical protein